MLCWRSLATWPPLLVLASALVPAGANGEAKDDSVSRLFGRAMQGIHVRNQEDEMEDAMLAKPGHLAIPAVKGPIHAVPGVKNVADSTTGTMISANHLQLRGKEAAASSPLQARQRPQASKSAVSQTPAAPSTAAKPATQARPFGQAYWRDGPDGLKYHDVVIGEGEAPGSSSLVKANWILSLTSTGDTLQACPYSNSPCEFAVGSDDLISEGQKDGDKVIRGLSVAVAGLGRMPPMRTLGRRKLLLPPRFAFGTQGAPAGRDLGEAVPPDSTLELTVQLVSFKNKNVED